MVEVDVVDRDGWRKRYPVEKNIIHIGSDPRNDIVLEPQRGVGVSVRHVQMIPGGNGAYRLVNVGDQEVYLGEGRDRRVPPRAFADVAIGETVRIGDFSLIFGGASNGAGPGFAVGAAMGALRESQSLSVRLSLTRNEIRPDEPIDGVIIVRNQGEKSGVQIRLDVEGLENHLYEIGPGPILATDAEARVYLRLQQPPDVHLPAGERTMVVRATAPQAYLGESATASQVVVVAARHDYRLKIQPID